MTAPRELGLVMPPEWAPHERCWMIWPCRAELWGERMAAARQTCAEVAKTIAQFEPVTMIARPDLTAEASLQCGQGIPVLPMDYDDSWSRDTAPTFVHDAKGALAGIDWRFDGYGGRAPKFDQDARLAGAICERLKIRRLEAPIVLEGGAVHVDGEGTALLCAASVLDPRRNPGTNRAQVETVLAEHLGVTRTLWLEGALMDDATGGHVDNLACFVRPGVVMALVAQDRDDADHEALRDNLERLRGAEDARGRAIEVVEIARPAPRLGEDGRRLPTSYVNFYIANGAVLVPMFDDPMDDAAYRAIAAAFPDRRVIQIDAGDLVLGGGGIHCITQQQPAPISQSKPG